MQSIKNIALIPNLTRKGAYHTSFDVIAILQRDGMSINMTEDLKDNYKNFGITFFKDTDSLISASDMVLTIGGDGTIMHAARHASPLKKPLLGINMGRLGYVAGLEPDELAMLSRVKT